MVPCLWIPLIGPTGAAKTPSITVARRKLRELDAGAYRRYAGEMEVWLGKPSAGRGAAPSDPTRLVNDITIEMVARWLGAGAGHGAVDADELTDWLRGLTRYRQGRRHRRRPLAVDVVRPAVALPARRARPAHRHPGRTARADRVRRAPAAPAAPARPGGRRVPAPVPAARVDDHRPDPRPGPGRTGLGRGDRQAVRRHRSADLAPGGPRRELWRDVQRRWKTAQDGPEPPAVAAALAKADEQAARIALVLAESLDPAAGGPIPEQAMHAAVAITDYVMGVWRAMGPGETLVLRPPRHRAGSRRRCAGRLARAARRPVNRPGHPPQRRRRHPYRR